MNVFNECLLIPLNKQRIEIYKALIKGMPNIYLKTTEKNWLSQKFGVLRLKHSSPAQFLGSSSSRKYNWILKLVIAT